MNYNYEYDESSGNLIVYENGCFIAEVNLNDLFSGHYTIEVAETITNQISIKEICTKIRQDRLMVIWENFSNLGERIYA